MVGSDAVWHNKLIQGDNLAVMAALLPELCGKFALIYLDPPFFTGKEWKSRSHGSEPVPPRDRSAGLLMDLADNALPTDATATSQAPISSEIQNRSGFSDGWTGGLGAYLQWLFDRLTAARALLSDDGCLYLHLSWHAVHYAKLLLDEIFGVEQFQNEIVWCYREAINSKKRWNRKHDTLLFYSKGDRFTFNYDAVREPYSESTIKKFRSRDEKGPYRLMGRGITDSPLRSKRDIAPEMETLFPELTYRHYLGEGTLPVDYWYIDIENQASKSRTGYPTQKPEALLDRILLASSNEGDLIGDFCCGSGTTLAVADRLGRRWAGCDAGSYAVDTSRARLVSRGASFEEFRTG
jgi:DNA modification methylase